MSTLEDALLFQLKAAKLPRPEREYRFHPTRTWRFDFAWPAQKVAAEVEGTTWARGRHTRGAGYEADCQKYNTAVLGGWQVVRFTAAMVAGGEALELLGITDLSGELQTWDETAAVMSVLDGVVSVDSGSAASGRRPGQTDVGAPACRE